jgi:hypothetical protein
MRRLAFLSSFLLIFTNVLVGQSFNNVGSSGAQFLKIGVGARPMGMGGAYGSIAGDVTSLAWNPAGIGTVYSLSGTFEHTEWVAGLDHNFIGLVVPVTDQFSLGFHTVYLTSGQIEITTIDDPEGTGRFYDSRDIAVGLTSSVRLTTQLTFATTIKYIEERIYDVTSNGLAVDAGMWYATEFRGLNLGFAVSNLGFEQTFEGRQLEVNYTPGSPGEPPVDAQLQAEPFKLPLMFRASGSFDLFQMFAEPLDDHQLLTAVDFVQQSDTRERLIVGTEYSWQRLVSLRSGYEFNADELSWSAGGGVRVRLADFQIGFDYAASSLGRFGIGHRVGLTLIAR